MESPLQIVSPVALLARVAIGSACTVIVCAKEVYVHPPGTAVVICTDTASPSFIVPAAGLQT